MDKLWPTQNWVGLVRLLMAPFAAFLSPICSEILEMMLVIAIGRFVFSSGFLMRGTTTPPLRMTIVSFGRRQRRKLVQMRSSSFSDVTGAEAHEVSSRVPQAFDGFLQLVVLEGVEGLVGCLVGCDLDGALDGAEESLELVLDELRRFGVVGVL